MEEKESVQVYKGHEPFNEGNRGWKSCSRRTGTAEPESQPMPLR